MKKLSLAIVLVFITGSLLAQVKIGHINSQELLAAMPETDMAQKQLEKLAKEHELELEKITVEFNKKYEDYSKKMDDRLNPMDDLVRVAKEAELQEIQQRVKITRQDAEKDLQSKRSALFQPIQKKAMEAVNEVGLENKFTYILDSGMGVIIYNDPNAEDILPLVKVKLGIE